MSCCVLLLWATSCGPVKVVGPRPLYPEANDDYIEIDSRQPTLRWEAFPNAEFLDAMPKGIEDRIADLTYDLRIWRAVEDYPAELAYARSGLAKPQHRLEVALDPAKQYHWTVRARFTLNGRSRVTHWGMLAEGSCIGADRKSRVPSLCHYRFSTPEE